MTVTFLHSLLSRWRQNWPYRMPALLHEGNQLGGGAAAMGHIEAGPFGGLPALVCHSMQHLLQQYTALLSRSCL